MQVQVVLEPLLEALEVPAAEHGLFTLVHGEQFGTPGPYEPEGQFVAIVIATNMESSAHSRRERECIVFSLIKVS